MIILAITILHTYLKSHTLFRTIHQMPHRGQSRKINGNVRMSIRMGHT